MNTHLLCIAPKQPLYSCLGHQTLSVKSFVLSTYFLFAIKESLFVSNKNKNDSYLLILILYSIYRIWQHTFNTIKKKKIVVYYGFPIYNNYLQSSFNNLRVLLFERGYS